MAIDVDPDWWKTLFDEIYLLTDARSVDNERITRREIDVVTSLLPLQPSQRILDLCGGHGRHAAELCRRGFNRCTVLDYSQPLLALGARNVKRRGYPVRFVQGDARRAAFAAERFDHVLILGNSIGYILEPDADLRIMQESRRLLRSGGWLLLDVTDGPAVRSKTTPSAWHEIGDDVVVCRRREIEGDRICAREMVLSKDQGMIRDKTYCIRLYDADALISLAERAGFTNIAVHTAASFPDRTEDIGCMNHRLLVAARKP